MTWNLIWNWFEIWLELDMKSIWNELEIDFLLTCIGINHYKNYVKSITSCNVDICKKCVRYYITNSIKNRGFESHNIIIECEREKLYYRINNRVDLMIKAGLEEEAYNLKDNKDLNTLNTVGYKEFFTYFDNKISYSEAVEKIKQNTRNYAKRQITWLKKYKNSIKINYNDNIESIFKNLNNILWKHSKF